MSALLARVAGFVTDVASERPTVAVRASVVAENVDGLVFRDGAEGLLGPAGFDSIEFEVGADALGSLALADTLRPGDDRVRVGWLYLCGTLQADGVAVPVLQPLVSRLVQLRLDKEAGAGATVVTARATSDLELIPLLGDRTVEAGLIGRMPSPSDLPAVSHWVQDVLRAIGLSAEVPIERVSPFERVGRSGLTIVPFVGFHAGDRELPSVQDDERTLWDGVDGALAGTSFAELVIPTTHGVRAAVPDEPVETLGLRLNSEQVAVVHRARAERIVPVTGAPGTGKTRTIVSIALDAVSSGKSVLIATRSHHARDVIEEFLGTTAGPDPVTFGSEIDRAKSIRRLQERQYGASGGAGRDDDAMSRYTVRLRQLTELHEQRRAAAHQAWDAQWGRGEQRLEGLAADEAALARAIAIRRDLQKRLPFRKGRLARELIRIVEPEDGQLQTALRMLDEAIAEQPADGPSRPFAELLESVEQSGADIRRLTGEAAALRIRMLATAADLHAVRVLVRELSVGSRQRLFRRGTVPASSITAVEPLWLGTLDEIDRMLPASPAMFDLAILDEAAQASMGDALPALARAHSAVVVGDPQQMRHDSPRTDRDVEVSARMFEIPAELVARLAPHRLTVFDVAAQTADVSVLRRHYRSVPHIIEFPADEFYAGQVDVMTRRPQTESADALLEIDAGGVWDGGVNQAEIELIMRQLQAQFGRNRTVGVIAPFPPQVAALVARIEAELGVDRINEIGLRVGTVDEFQGGERDLMIVSTVVSPGAPAAAFEFVNDPNVFNVMITRARLANYVVTSVPPDGTTLLGRWLRYAADSPAPHAGSPSADPWVNSLADDFRSAGVAVRTNYRVGPHTIDLVVGEGSAALGIDAGAAADVEDPVERRRELHALQWRMIDLPADRWSDRRAEIVTEILGQLGA